MKKTILMLVAALFVLIAVNAQTRKVTPRIRKSGNPAQVIKGKTVPIRSRQADKRKVVLLKFWYIYVSKFEETFICKREIDALPPIIRFAVFILLTEPSRIPLFNLLAIELLMAE